MVTRAQKQEKIEALRQDFQGGYLAFVADFKGLSVSDLSQLRQKLKPLGACCAVAKNTLADIAVRDGELQALKEHLRGPTLLVVAKEDVAGTVKAFYEFQKKLDSKLLVRGGAMAGEARALDSEEIKQIGELPPLEVIMAQIAGMIVQGPTSVASSINQVIGGIGELSEKVAEQRQSSGT